MDTPVTSASDEARVQPDTSRTLHGSSLEAALRAGKHRGGGLDADSLAGLDLSGLNLSEVDLSGLDLSGCNLLKTDLRNADLAGTDITGAELTGADLRGANLERVQAAGAGLGMADLSGAHVFQADLSGAVLTGAKLTNTNLNFANLRGARMRQANMEKADFTSADLREAEMSLCQVRGAVFNNADFRGARLRAVAGFERALWYGVDIRDINFAGAYRLRRHVIDENYLKEVREGGRWQRAMYNIWWLTSDCGRSLLRWCGLITITTAFFAAAFAISGVHLNHHEAGVVTYFYYSVVTLTTLGYGDIVPDTSMGQILVILEVCFGYLMLGGLISIFANKLARRGE